MRSKLAEQDYNALIAEGLQPTFADTIRLNAAGLAVERAGDAVPLGAPPRVAWLDDWCFWEPTLARLVWLDRARQLVGDTTSDLTLAAFACWAGEEDLPPLKSTRRLTRRVEKFASRVLKPFTLSQILAAVSYAMDGNDAADGEIVAEGKPSVKDPPESVYAPAHALFAAVVANGLDATAALSLTFRNVERLLAIAALRQGVDVAKSAHAQAFGAYALALAQIKSRLLDEAQAGGAVPCAPSAAPQTQKESEVN